MTHHQVAGKPVLKVTRVPIFRLHYRDLERFLEQVYGMEGFDFLAATGLTPRICPEFIVSSELPNLWNGKQQADRIRNGYRTRNVGLILNVLAVDGYIEAGTYIIDTKPEADPVAVYKHLLRRTRDPDSPECVAFKQSHLDNEEFTERAETLERICRELVSRKAG